MTEVIEDLGGAVGQKAGVAEEHSAVEVHSYPAYHHGAGQLAGVVAEKDHVADTVTGVAVEKPGAVIHLADHLEESKPR